MQDKSTPIPLDNSDVIWCEARGVPLDTFRAVRDRLITRHGITLGADDPRPETERVYVAIAAEVDRVRRGDTTAEAVEQAGGLYGCLAVAAIRAMEGGAE